MYIQKEVIYPLELRFNRAYGLWHDEKRSQLSSALLHAAAPSLFYHVLLGVILLLPLVIVPSVQYHTIYIYSNGSNINQRSSSVVIAWWFIAYRAYCYGAHKTKASARKRGTRSYHRPLLVFRMPAHISRVALVGRGGTYRESNTLTQR